jgi:sigma-B regulation protein RsbU (phosphoserine phosphatase)
MSREQDRIKQSLHLAREVQQNLLPHRPPEIEGLDIAGKSIYCDETGGDYYDFITTDQEGGRIAIAVGDVSGHGISSALLMATVRSSLHQRSALPGGSSADIITDVNRQLSRDVEDSGQFMTMFFLNIDPEGKSLQWVRAGHDPAIFYDPKTDLFEDLGGKGIALGINEDVLFQDNEKAGLEKGHLIFLSTDGIWEALNPSGEMFGKARVCEILREHASSSAEAIIDSVIEGLHRFTKGVILEDDITLVIVKLV